MSDELPNGWVATVDPDSGETYYANTITGETSWELPKVARLVYPILLVCLTLVSF